MFDAWGCRCLASYGKVCMLYFWVPGDSACMTAYTSISQYKLISKFTMETSASLCVGTFEMTATLFTAAMLYLHRWQSSDYLLERLGHRTVPVEVGSNYLAQGWGQKMITFREFFSAAFGCRPSTGNRSTGQPRRGVHSENWQEGSGGGVVRSCTQCPVDTQSGVNEPDNKRQRSASPSHTQNDRLLYLAQHSLFDQVRDLRKDIMVCTSLVVMPCRQHCSCHESPAPGYPHASGPQTTCIHNVCLLLL